MELFDDKGTPAPRIDTDENHEVLELTLDDLSYVAGGYRKTDFGA